MLAEGETYSDVGGSVYLGVNDSPDNWNEITEAEYEAVVSAEESEKP